MSKDYLYKKKKSALRKKKLTYGQVGPFLSMFNTGPMAKRAALENFYMVKVAGEDSFFTKVKAGWAASQHYSPKEIKQLGTKGYIVHPKGSMNKRARDEAYYNYLMAKEAGVGVSAGPVTWTPSMGVLGSFAHPAPNKRDFNSYKKWKEMEHEGGKSLRSRRYTDRALSGMTVGGLAGLAMYAPRYGAMAPVAALPVMGIGGLAGLGYAMYEEDPKG